MMNSIKKRSYSKKGRKPAPSAPGSPPHSIAQDGGTTDKKGRPAKFYRHRQIRYDKIGPLKYSVGVAPFIGGGNHIMEVPEVMEKGGTLTRKRWAYGGNKFGQRKRATQRQKEAYKRKMRQAFANNDHYALGLLGIGQKTITGHYQRRPYLEPAARKAADELPGLFTFVSHVR
jgi:hypothetical protein